MRVLFLTSRMPYPPVGGDRFRVYHMLRAAAEAGHEVHLLTFDVRRRAPVELAPLEEVVRSVEVVPLAASTSLFRAAQALLGRVPLQAAYYRSGRMQARVEAAIRRLRPDVVVTHLFRMAPYALPHLGRTRARFILDMTDVISAGIERSLPFRRGADRWVYRLEAPRIRAFETRIAPRFDECWVISQAEARSLEGIAPGATIRVVPNGVGADRLRTCRPREEARFLFLGYHDVFHNRDAVRFLVREVFPRVRARISDATLAIAGKGSDAVRPWAERVPGVRVLGFVDDVVGELQRATAFVAPHRFAAGVQNKVLQALACGTPVVTTSVVRAGLEPIPEDALRVADHPDEIARHLVSLARDREAAERMGATGRAWARTRFCWDASVLALENARSDGASEPRGHALVAAPPALPI